MLHDLKDIEDGIQLLSKLRYLRVLALQVLCPFVLHGSG